MTADIWAGSQPVDRCDLCGNDDFEPIGRRDRRGRPLTTIVCRICGLVSHGRLPSDRALRQYYQQIYRREYHGEFAPSAYRVVREWQRGGRMVRQLSPFLDRGDRVFEVGSGIGCNVKRFELAGYEASGVEPGEGFWRFSHGKLRARVVRGVLSELRPAGQFDLVLLVHVLEHLKSPREALTHIRGLLRPGGKLYVEVPAFGCPHAAPGKLFHVAHLYNFTPATLASLGLATGFDVVQSLPSRNEKDQRVLFRRRETTADEPVRYDDLGYRQAVAAVSRHTTFSYHFRPTYVKNRLSSLLSHASDRVAASWRMQWILRRCQHPGGLTATRSEPVRPELVLPERMLPEMGLPEMSLPEVGEDRAYWPAV